MTEYVVNENAEKMTNNTQKCSNCSDFFSHSTPNNELIFNLDELEPEAFGKNNNFEDFACVKTERSVSVSAAIEDVFNLTYVNHFIIDGNSVSSSSLKNDNITGGDIFSLCRPCKTSLQTLYQNYTLFAGRRTSDSILSKKIEILNRGLIRALPFLLNDANNNNNNNNKDDGKEQEKENEKISISQSNAKSTFSNNNNNNTFPNFTFKFGSSSFNNVNVKSSSSFKIHDYSKNQNPALVVSPGGIIYTTAQLQKEQQHQKQQQGTKIISDDQENYVQEIMTKTTTTTTTEFKRAGGTSTQNIHVREEPYSDFLSFDDDDDDDDDASDKDLEMLDNDHEDSLNTPSSFLKPLTGILKPSSSSFYANSEEEEEENTTTITSASTSTATLSNAEKAKVQFSPSHAIFKIKSNLEEEGSATSSNKNDDNDTTFNSVNSPSTSSASISLPSEIVTTNITATTIELSSPLAPAARGKMEAKKNKTILKGKVNKVKATPYPKKEQRKTRIKKSTSDIPTPTISKSKGINKKNQPSSVQTRRRKESSEKKTTPDQVQNEEQQQQQQSENDNNNNKNVIINESIVTNNNGESKVKRLHRRRRRSDVLAANEEEEEGPRSITTGAMRTRKSKTKSPNRMKKVVQVTKNENETVEAAKAKDISQQKIPTPKTKHPCSQCSATFDTKFLCFRHTTMQHTMANITPPFTCPTCAEVSKNKEQYFRHVYRVGGCNSNSSLTPNSIISGKTPQSSNNVTTAVSTGQSVKAATIIKASTGESKRSQNNRKRSLTTPASTTTLSDMTTRSGKRAKRDASVPPGTGNETVYPIHSTPKRITLRSRTKSNA